MNPKIATFQELRTKTEQALPDELVDRLPDIRRTKDWDEYEAVVLSFQRNELVTVFENMGGTFTGNEKGRISRVNMVKRIKDDTCQAGF